MDAMKIIDEGYTVTGLPDGDKIVVRWISEDGATLSYTEILVDGRSFDLAGFRDYVDGLKTALDYAETVEERNTRP